MPGLEHLRENFNLLSPEDKVRFIRNYRTRRAADLAKPATYGRKNTKSKETVTKYQQLGLSPEEIEVCKALGLKPKDIIALKEQANANK